MDKKAPQDKELLFQLAVIRQKLPDMYRHLVGHIRELGKIAENLSANK
jgi:hypothetical protein